MFKGTGKAFIWQCNATYVFDYYLSYVFIGVYFAFLIVEMLF